jgi:hypothetical protein
MARNISLLLSYFLTLSWQDIQLMSKRLDTILFNIPFVTTDIETSTQSLEILQDIYALTSQSNIILISRPFQGFFHYAYHRAISSI